MYRFMYRLLSKIYHLSILLIAFFILLFVKLLGFFYIIKFISIRSDVIGHFIEASERYLISKKKR